MGVKRDVMGPHHGTAADNYRRVALEEVELGHCAKRSAPACRRAAGLGHGGCEERTTSPQSSLTSSPTLAVTIFLNTLL